jgi:uncharacterized membrane protein YcjF (UPF0283 family)
MAVLFLLVALVVLGMLANRFGVDTRDTRRPLPW